jgi:LacI family transcriptional regulator, galactose operon repressor
MAKRATIADLAAAAGVSIATVDRVLNQRLPVSEATAVRVAEAAETINYHAAGLLKQRLAEAPPRAFAFLLQKKRDEFYQTLAAELAAAAKSARFVRAKPQIVFIDELVPSVIAAKIRECGRNADALAVVAVDHPHVNQAIEELAGKGKPTFALLSDLSAPSRAGYIGVDGRKSGRTAAWAISRLAKRPGKVAVLVGTHRYLSQELAEMSFRSYFREHAPQFQLLESIVNLEDHRIAYEATINLLTKKDAPAGIYLAGGGMKGMINALRQEEAGGKLVAVCNELLPFTKAALIDGVVDLVLATPLATLAARAVEAMARATSGEAPGMAQILLPAELCVSENV